MENASTNNLSAIERALIAARARKAAREAVETPVDEAAAGERPDLVVAKVTAKGSPDAAARRAEREAAAAASKARRDAERAARRAEKEARAAAAPPRGTAKIERLRDRLAPLSAELSPAYDDLVARFGTRDLDALAQHLLVRVRAAAMSASQDRRGGVEVGARVRITGGEPRFVGREGTVTKVQRIRCFVEIEGVKSPVYTFLADVEAV